MWTNIFSIILFLGLMSSIQMIEENNSSKVSEDIFVECDQKSRIRKETKDRKTVCKVECYTKLNNPGICQIQAMNPCKTLSEDTEIVKCEKNMGESPTFQSICCPFKDEKQENSGQITTNVPPIIEGEECGKRPTISAIVGGIDAQPNTWPWVVSVYEKSEAKGSPRFICGGAIINRNYILSAAHCFVRSNTQKVRPNRFLVKVGAHKLSDTNIKFLEISEIITHKNYDINQHYFDIALIKVKHKIEFLPTVTPVCLPKQNLFKESFRGKKAIIVGWGAQRFGGLVSDTLKEAEVDIIDTNECNRNYSQVIGHQMAFPRGINEQHICAGLPTGGRDSCQGDSGGPLTIEIEDRWYQLGVVSFGYKCAEPGFPGIYAKVKYFIDWIESRIK